MGALGEAGKTDSPDKAEAPYRGDMHNRITKIDRGVNRIEYWISFFILAGGPMTAIWKWAFGNMNWRLNTYMNSFEIEARVLPIRPLLLREIVPTYCIMLKITDNAKMGI